MRASDAALAVLVAAGLALGAADFELVVPGLGGPTICAKSVEVCEAARAAVRAGRWDLGVDPSTPTACRSRPGCFPSDSNFIRGFNHPGERRTP
jgi:hypothetical protein